MFKPLLIAIFLLVSLGTPARSQPVPSELLRTWVEEQTEEAEALEKIAATETSARMTDGPFGVRRTYVTARIEGDPGTDRWRREVLSVEHADDRGRPSGSPPGRLRHRRAEGPGSPLPPFLEAALFPLRQLARLHPTGPVRPDTTAGLYAWRLELDRGDAPGPVERVTLWFDRRSRALRRSRAIIALPRTGAPLIVTTDYERLEGLDVPRRRLIEGTVRIERRRRPFTLLFEHDATFAITSSIAGMPRRLGTWRGARRISRMQSLTFDAYIARLRERLAGPLPGQEAQRTMAPEHRRDLSPAATCREAGVLVLLFPMEGAPALVLTVRHARLSQHAGQISFPGGRREAGEDLRTTALREAYEEIGLLPSSVTVLGALSPLYILHSNYCVYPFVGMVSRAPTFRPHNDEVEAILHVPVAQLLEPGRRRWEPWTLRGQPVMVPFFAIGEHKIWGATAMMLAELVALS